MTSWLNRQMVNVFPAMALRREIARRRLTRLQSQEKRRTRPFEGVAGGRSRSGFLSSATSADAALQGADSLREHVRQMERNNGFVAGPIKRIVNNVVGQGFHFQSRVKPDENDYFFPKITEADAKRFNTETERAFKIWSGEADQRLILNFTFLLRTIEGALIRDGEILAVARESNRPGRFVPTCLQLLEADRIQTPLSESTNPKIRRGFRYDDEGVPVACFVLKNHPGDSPLRGLKDQDFEEINVFDDNGVRRVFHLFNPLRPEQSRGFSEYAAALKDLQDIERYREAEILAALEAACLVGFVKTPEPDTFQQNLTSDYVDEYDADGTRRRIHEFAPNQWHYLDPGEDVTIHSPNRPNEQFGAITEHMLEGPANALDIPPEVLTQDWKGMNYSNARTVLLQFYLACFVRRRYLIDFFCRPFHRLLIRRLVALGRVQAPGFTRREPDFLEHQWITPGWAWVDPVKEAQGKQIELANDMESLANVAAGKGMDWEELLDQRAREIAKRKELEKRYGISFSTDQKEAGFQATKDGEEEENQDD